MVVLNIMGKIDPICVSQKLKLYVGNLPNSEENDWNATLVEEMKIALKLSTEKSKLYSGRYGKAIIKDIKEITKKKYPQLCVEKMSEDECFKHLADEMIYIYFEYDYDDMPIGDWTTNCFDGRFCEGDYTTKIVDFIYSICNEKIYREYPQIPTSAPYSIYVSDDNKINNYYSIFNGTTEIEQLLNNLIQFGSLLDNFLLEENDFYFFDYLCTELYQIERSPFTANHCQKIYSLCEFFLEKDSDKELDRKLPPFINDWYSKEDREKIAMLARQVRNKVAHGDFSKFREKIEEYAMEIMEKKGFWFDYSEYSRQNWAIMNLSITLLDSVKNLTAAVLTDKERIYNIKNEK